MYRQLKWWSCGWYSVKDFKYWYWIQDDYGNAVLTSRLAIARFQNVWWISPDVV